MATQVAWQALANRRSSILVPPALREKTFKKDTGVGADFAMHRKIGSNDRTATGHRFHKWMSECFGVSRSNVNVAGFVKMVQETIRSRAQFHDFVRHTESAHEVGCGSCLVCTRICARPQLAGEDNLILGFFRRSLRGAEHERASRNCDSNCSDSRTGTEAHFPCTKALLRYCRGTALAGKKGVMIEPW